MTAPNGSENTPLEDMDVSTELWAILHNQGLNHTST